MGDIPLFVRRYLSKQSQEILRRLPSIRGGYLAHLNKALEDYAYRTHISLYCLNPTCSAYRNGWVRRTRMTAAQHPPLCDHCNKPMGEL